MSKMADVAKVYEEKLNHIKSLDISPLEKSKLIMKNMEEFERELSIAHEEEIRKLGPMPTFPNLNW